MLYLTAFLTGFHDNVNEPSLVIRASMFGVLIFLLTVNGTTIGLLNFVGVLADIS